MNPRGLGADPVAPPRGSSQDRDPPGPQPGGWTDRIRRRAREEEPERDPPERGISGVLIPILPVEPEPLVLYTRRSEHLSAHPGEISFPGGGREARDASLRETALRETEEETGLAPSDVDVLGHVTDFRTFHDLLVCAYVGVIDPDAVLGEPSTPHEVAERLLVPLEALVEGKGTPALGAGHEVELGGDPLGRVYPVRSYEARQLPEEHRGGGVLHYWRLADATTVWGITGELTARFLRSTLDWQPPHAPKRLGSEDEVRP